MFFSLNSQQKEKEKILFNVTSRNADKYKKSQLQIIQNQQVLPNLILILCKNSQKFAFSIQKRLNLT